MPNITHLLEAANRGDRQAAADLLPLVYDELRNLAAARMANEAPGHTLDATALVHEAYLRLTGEASFQSRSHFMRAAAESMRRILVGCGLAAAPFMRPFPLESRLRKRESANRSMWAASVCVDKLHPRFH